MQKDNILQNIMVAQYPHLTKEGKDSILKNYKEPQEAKPGGATDEEIVRIDREMARQALGIKQRIIVVKRKRHR